MKKLTLKNILIGALLVIAPSSVFAQNGFEVIERFANGLCVRPSLEGHTNTIIADGKANADLRIQLINMGIEVNGDVQASQLEWKGISNTKNRADNYEKCTSDKLNTVTQSPALMALLVNARVVNNTEEDWVVCWQGRSEHEFLIAYPKKYALLGINLDGQVFNRPWDRVDEDLSNDSLKMCRINGTWYGAAQSWFPKASYLELQENTVLVCEHSPGCKGKKWSMKPSGPPPGKVDLMYTPPIGYKTQILGYEPSEGF